MDAAGKPTEASQPPPQAASAAQISAVLGNDDILREILVRLDFPTCLVRAAAVSKRWLRHASDPAFLRRFRLLHPPRLLGFYLRSSHTRLRFISLPQPPELAAVIRHGKLDLGRDARDVLDCCNGRLIVKIRCDDRRSQTTVWRPLHPERGATVPPLLLPLTLGLHGTIFHTQHFLLRADGEDTAISAVDVIMSNLGQARAQLHDFQAGDWGEARNSDLINLHGQLKIGECECKPPLLAHGKIYLMCMPQYILGLDVQSMSLFSIKLPNGVKFKDEANIGLSRAKGSGFCLVHVRRFQISVWSYTMDHNSTGNWELIDTVPLCQVFGPNADQAADVRVAAVGDNADFVFLITENEVFYLHVSSRTVEKVYELVQDEDLLEISPFMMVWPPTFPTLNGGHDNDE